MEMSPGELLEKLLAVMTQSGASDLHLATERAPRLRVQGKLRPCPGFVEPFNATTVCGLATKLIGEDPDVGLRESGSADGSLSSDDGGRFRFNVYQRAPGLAIALRQLEDSFRSLEELGLPAQLNRWCELNDGLILVAGPTGSGKSTTLATLIDTINRERETHIITIEDPIEYVHLSRKSIVDQRQVGVHAPDFQSALVASLRQDPDVILVGEIRDRNTIRTALTAAETGHLVFATVHAPDCAGALQRLISVFPADEQNGILRQLALNLRGVLAQHLIPADGPAAAPEQDFSNGRRSRILLTEVMQVTPAVANLVANARFNQIQSFMESGGSDGMQTLEANIISWIQTRYLTEHQALRWTHRPVLLKERLQRQKRTPLKR